MGCHPADGSLRGQSRRNAGRPSRRSPAVFSSQALRDWGTALNAKAAWPERNWGLADPCSIGWA